VLSFTAGTMGHFLTKSRLWESVALLVVAFLLFRPDYVMNRIEPPYDAIDPARLEQVVGKAPVGEEIRIHVRGPDFNSGKIKKKTLLFIVPEGKDGTARLKAQGLTLIPEGDIVKLDEPFPGTPFFDQMGVFDFYGDEPVVVIAAEAKADQMPKELIFIPGLILLGLIMLSQQTRIRREGVKI